MFPSPNCIDIDDNPFDSLLKTRSPSSSSFSSSFLSHQNPNSSLLFNFPSPFLDEHESPLNQIFFQNQNQNQNQNHNKNHDHDNLVKSSSKMKEIDRNPSAAAAAASPARRRRTGKKDRHSKICTAQGIRDRRMRLSLQVARKFFDLQDMLGYDKASKTIEWLFTQSKKAIKELVEDVKSESFVSECEDRMSGIEEINSNAAVISPATGAPAEIIVKPSSSTTRPNARESREKARARARSRTREKMMGKRLHFSEEDHCFKPNPRDVIIPFEGVDHDHDQEQIRVSPNYQFSDVGMIEKFLGNSSSSTSCPISEYHCGGDPSLMGFIGNWDHVLSIERSNNCFQYAGNLNSVYSVTPEFP